MNHNKCIKCCVWAHTRAHECTGKLGLNTEQKNKDKIEITPDNKQSKVGQTHLSWKYCLLVMFGKPVGEPLIKRYFCNEFQQLEQY